MLTIEKYYTDGDQAAHALTASVDQAREEYKLGLVYDIQAGDACLITIQGRKEFRKFAASLLDVLAGMIEE